MNMAPLNFSFAAAALPLSQLASSEADRVRQESAAHELDTESIELADAAEGIGATKEEQQASDRDGDGRRPWERAAPRADDAHSATGENEGLSRPGKDPTGQAGSQLDLRG